MLELVGRCPGRRRGHGARRGGDRRVEGIGQRDRGHVLHVLVADDVRIDEIPLVARLARYPMLHMWPNSISTDPRSNPRVYTLSGGTGDVVMPEE